MSMGPVYRLKSRLMTARQHSRVGSRWWPCIRKAGKGTRNQTLSLVRRGEDVPTETDMSRKY